MRKSLNIADFTLGLASGSQPLLITDFAHMESQILKKEFSC